MLGLVMAMSRRAESVVLARQSLVPASTVTPATYLYFRSVPSTRRQILWPTHDTAGGA
jgi:hypothetical protein